MASHFIRIIAITMLIVTCMFLPFIPGAYDPLAVPLSSMAQLLGMAGLILVPIGLVWLVYESLKRTKKNWTQRDKTYHFALVALVASAIVAIPFSFGALVNNNRIFSLLTLVLCIYIVSKIARRLRAMKMGENRGFNPTPIYLICIPILVVLCRLFLIVPATGYSRNYAISKSERLIHDIEAYHVTNGHYPRSLQSLWTDYDPSVTGIEKFHYEPSGKAYNLYFEPFSYELGVREIVMYNKLDEHEMTSHDQDLLELTPTELNLQRGYNSVHDLPNAHWKYFWFD